MKKILAIFLFLCLLLTACGNVIIQNVYKTIYTDSNPIDDKKIKISFEKPRCSGGNNDYSLSINANLKNNEYETRTYKIKNVVLIKEATTAEYTVSHRNSITVEAEMKTTLSFSAKIPSSIEQDKYKLVLDINEINITYYLYEMPDELRENRKISYIISGKVVKEDTIKDGRTITNTFVYESSDNLNYCSQWFLDSEFKNQLNSTTVIKEDTKFYGIETSNFKWMSLSSDVYSFVNGVNHIPSNGILIIPSKYLNKEICIGNYAIRNINVKKIFIPKTTHVIYGGNFTGIGNAKIYYEGTETEWKKIFYNQSSAITENVIFNAKLSDL